MSEALAAWNGYAFDRPGSKRWESVNLAPTQSPTRPPREEHRLVRLVRAPGFEPGFKRWQRSVITATLRSQRASPPSPPFSKRRLAN